MAVMTSWAVWPLISATPTIAPSAARCFAIPSPSPRPAPEIRIGWPAKRGIRGRPHTCSSLRAQRSNPGRHAPRSGLLRRFAPRNDETGGAARPRSLHPEQLRGVVAVHVFVHPVDLAVGDAE